MGRKQDLIAALEHRQPAGTVPFWELQFQAWDTASGRHVVLGREFEALSADGQEKAMRANAEILLAVSAEFDYAALTVPGNYWYQAPGDLAYYCLPKETRFRQLEIIKELAPPDLVLVGSAGAIVAADYSMEFCCRLVDDPASIDEMAEKRLHDAIENAKRLRDCGAGIVVSASDIADNSGPFFNPEQMRRWILPNLARWAEALRAMGLYTVLHSDGNLTKYLDDLASTGINALQAIDPVAGMDMRQARQLVGNRLCLCGNIDCGLLLLGTPESVHAATRDLLNSCKAGGGLVLGCSNAVQREVPMANYRALVAAWREFGKY